MRGFVNINFRVRFSLCRSPSWQDLPATVRGNEPYASTCLERVVPRAVKSNRATIITWSLPRQDQRWYLCPNTQSESILTSDGDFPCSFWPEVQISTPSYVAKHREQASGLSRVHLWNHHPSNMALHDAQHVYI